MAPKRLSRGGGGRGPRIRDDELERMVALYTEGKSFQNIAKQVGRHWQTVRKYTIRELQNREGAAMRREALMSALAEHYRDLVQALQSVPATLKLPDKISYQVSADWQLPVPDRRSRLLLDALRESHIKESRLWSWWDQWNRAAKAKEEALRALRQKVSRAMARLDKSKGGEARIMGDSLAEALFERGTSISHGAPVHDPSELSVRLAEVVQARSNPEQLWLGESVVADGPGMGELKQSLAKVLKGATEWEEVGRLAELQQELAKLEDEIAEEVEILSLRRAFPGHCRLCPV
jgi:hypothetical protein